MNKSYSIFIFDADDTLFDFGKAESNAFELLMRQNNLPCTAEVVSTYKQINSALWKRFDAGEITKSVLQQQRFAQLLYELGAQGDPLAFNHEYLLHLGEGTFLLPGAKDLCQALHSVGKKLYIITNGISLAQRARFSHSEICSFFENIFISEELESQKPQKVFFDRVLAHLGDVNFRDILIVGDSLSSDIRGGNNANLDTCWFNPNALACPDHIHPTYEVKTLSEILQFA